MFQMGRCMIQTYNGTTLQLPRSRFRYGTQIPIVLDLWRLTLGKRLFIA